MSVDLHKFDLLFAVHEMGNELVLFFGRRLEYVSSSTSRLLSTRLKLFRFVVACCAGVTRVSNFDNLYCKGLNEFC